MCAHAGVSMHALYIWICRSEVSITCLPQLLCTLVFLDGALLNSEDSYTGSTGWPMHFSSHPSPLFPYSLPRTEVTNESDTIFGVWHGYLGSKFKSSCMYGKKVTSWSISTPLSYYILKSHLQLDHCINYYFFCHLEKNTMTKRNLRKSLFEFKVLEG